MRGVVYSSSYTNVNIYVQDDDLGADFSCGIIVPSIIPGYAANIFNGSDKIAVVCNAPSSFEEKGIAEGNLIAKKTQSSGLDMAVGLPDDFKILVLA